MHDGRANMIRAIKHETRLPGTSTNFIFLHSPQKACYFIKVMQGYYYFLLLLFSIVLLLLFCHRRRMHVTSQPSIPVPLSRAAVEDQLLQQQRLPLLSPVAVRHFQGVQDARADRERVHHRAAAAALLHRVQRALGQQAVGDVVPL